VTKDDYDDVSKLNRPDVFRLSIGLSRATFVSLFEAQPAPPGDGGVANAGPDFTVLNMVMPHPVYGSMFWVCILNPTDETFQSKVVPLLLMRTTWRAAGRQNAKHV
jgi:hypothetical protein